jgi:hypothetical protein
VKLKSFVVLATIVAGVCAPLSASAQRRGELPPARGDFLLRDGRWVEAESEFYAQSDKAPRDAIARAALGRFLAMRGAVKPGSVLVEEAKKFGLDAATYRSLITPMKAILDWRTATANVRNDSTISIRTSRDPEVLFQVGLPKTDRNGRIEGSVDASEVIWHNVVDRPIGLDSLNERGRPMGIEIFEALVPSIDVREEEMTLHANRSSALSARGQRYQVLRWTDGVKVLVGDHNVQPLTFFLRQQRPRWWQLDLVHGLLVVR